MKRKFTSVFTFLGAGIPNTGRVYLHTACTLGESYRVTETLKWDSQVR